MNKSNKDHKVHYNYFIYTGNAYPHKNLKRLIEALVILNEVKEKKVGLKIVSARSVFSDRLVQLVKELKAENFIEIMGFKSDLELNKLYKNCVAFVFPTLEEGFGLPPMEAINAGAVAVVSDIPVLKEVYKDSVFYFDPYVVESIVESLTKVINMNPQEKAVFLRNSQQFVKKYSWVEMAKNTLNLYESVV